MMKRIRINRTMKNTWKKVAGIVREMEERRERDNTNRKNKKGNKNDNSN